MSNAKCKSITLSRFAKAEEVLHTSGSGETFLIPVLIKILEQQDQTHLHTDRVNYFIRLAVLSKPIILAQNP